MKNRIKFVSVQINNDRKDWLFRFIPPSVLYLASMTPVEFDITHVDKNFEEINQDNTDLVCISVLSTNSKEVFNLADNYIRKGLKVILGGHYVSLMPEKCKEHATTIVIGMCETSLWKVILRDFTNNCLRKIYANNSKEELELPTNRRIYTNKIWNDNVIITSTGCPNDCEFCSVTKVCGRKIRNRPVEDVVKELKYLIQRARKKMFQRYFFILDDNIVANKVYAKKLFRALIPLNIRWFGQSDISIAKDSELLDLAHKSGCRWLFIGYESLSHDSLKNYVKQRLIDDYLGLTKSIKNKKIIIYGSFVFGFDGEQKNIFEKTLNFIKRANIDLCGFNILVPYEGTALYERLNNEKRLIISRHTNNFNRAILSQQYLTKGMRYSEIVDGIEMLDKKFYSLRNTYLKLRSIKNDFGIKYMLLFLPFYVFFYISKRVLYLKRDINKKINFYK
jgi:radical SAM superfamily enzyme YgiQ (UPF0313 family)